LFLSLSSFFSLPSLSQLWLFFNLSLLIVFAMHQAGVAPSLVDVGTQMREGNIPLRGAHLVYAHTYMPPQHLLSQAVHSTAQVTIHDLGGVSLSFLDNYLTQLCSRRDSLEGQLTLLYVPASLDLGQLLSRHKLSLAASYGPHLSTERLPDLSHGVWHALQHLQLLAYQVC
jgi:type III secretory pathway component EscS